MTVLVVPFTYIYTGNSDTFLFVALILLGLMTLLVVPCTEIMGTNDTFDCFLH